MNGIARTRSCRVAAILGCLLLATVGAAPGWSEEAPAEAVKVLHIGYENTSYYPWSMPEGRGVDLLLLKEIAPLCGSRIEFLPLPWKDCLDRLAAGTLDGVINASHTPERGKLYRYPIRDGQVNPALRLHIDGYSLYRRKNQPVCWREGKVQNYLGPVAAQQGFSVVDVLRAAGAAVDDHYTSAEEILHQMQQGEVPAAALLYTNADHLLQRHPEWAEAIEKCDDDIVSKPYYLIFNHDFYTGNSLLCENIWQQIAGLRASARYGKLIARIYAEESPTTPQYTPAANHRETR